MRSKITKTGFTPRMLALAVFQLAFLSYAGAQKNAKDSVVFNFKASEQHWTVPQGITSVHIEAFGAQGGSAKGGKGGHVQSDLKVTPGEKLVIHVGSQPSGSEAGYNGGGSGCGNGFGGGGASDIRIGGAGLESRVIVAGGGGGAGYGGFGGSGGALTGGEGKYVADGSAPDHDAKGGTQEAGGSGARTYFSKPGNAGTGGDGINNRGECSNGAMAGGGGGYFGGGGSGAGGGGGGSSYTNTSNSHVEHHQGVQEGNGKIVISW